MQFLTDVVVAERYAVVPETIRRWVKEGIFPGPVYIAGSTRWRLSDVEAFDAALPTTPGSKRRGRPRKAPQTLDQALSGLDLDAAVSEAAAVNLGAR